MVGRVRCGLLTGERGPQVAVAAWPGGWELSPRAVGALEDQGLGPAARQGMHLGSQCWEGVMRP